MPSDIARAPRGVTRDDVARLAGVSSAVVSYVVNDGPRRVAPATRQRVLEAIEKLGYQPNAAARSLTTGRSGLIGLIVPDVRNPYFGALAQSVEVRARAEGANVVLVQGSTGRVSELVGSLSGHLVAGIITATVPEPEALAIAIRHKVPMVRLSLVPPDVDATSVIPDYHAGAMEATKHLIEVHGHRRIVLIAGSDVPEDPHGHPIDERQRGWHDAMVSAGLPTDAVLHVRWSAGAGWDAARLLSERYPEHTAVFAMSDQQSIGLLAGLNRLGRSVPEDVAITSFDGSPEAEYTIPSLTTSAPPLAAMATAAVEQLLHGSTSQRIFRPELVVRRSCGCRGEVT